MSNQGRDFIKLGVSALREAVFSGEVSALECAEGACDAIEAHNGQLNAFVEYNRERALATAEVVDSELARGLAGQLAGVPYAIKDTTDVAGMRTTAGSGTRLDHMAEEDSTCARRMRDAGGVFVGRTNTPEFGFRCTTAFGLFGATHNPWSLQLSAGGSSGGAAAAVAAGLVPVAEGSDGGGSIRIPASCCGVMGFKPSRGRVSNFPEVAALRAGLVVHGVLARRTRDVAIALDVISGYESGDPYWLGRLGPTPVGEGGLEGPVRIGLVQRAAAEPVDEVAKAFSEAVDLVKELGWRVEHSPANLSGMSTTYRTVLECHMAAETRPECGFTDEYVEWCWRRGRGVMATDYINALDRMRLWGVAIARAAEAYDALLTPTLTDLPGDVHDFQSDVSSAAALDLSFTAYTYPFNFSGQPAVSLPLGWSSAGVPIGIQLVGRGGDDARLLQLAQVLELATDWPSRWPPLITGK